jgi:hypothetical protein
VDVLDSVSWGRVNVQQNSDGVQMINMIVQELQIVGKKVAVHGNPERVLQRWGLNGEQVDPYQILQI